MLYIAYTREDALLAVQLVEDLADLGVQVWLDLNQIGPGVDWEAAQRAAIEACEGLIVVLSPEALQRQHMRREVNQALTHDKPIYLAAARPSPWQDWMQHSPVADFTADYEAGLDALLLLVMGDTISTDATQNLDPADAFLREAETGQRSNPTQRRREDRPETSIFFRLRRRP